MIDFVLPNTEDGSMEFKQWLADKHEQSVVSFPTDAYGYGIKKDGQIVGACVLQSFHAAGDYLASMYSDDPRLFFSKKIPAFVLKVPFSEPFNGRRLTLIISCKNSRTVEAALRMGFRSEGILTKHFEDDDAIIMCLLRSQVVEV